MNVRGGFIPDATVWRGEETGDKILEADDIQ